MQDAVEQVSWSIFTLIMYFFGNNTTTITTHSSTEAEPMVSQRHFVNKD